MSAAGTLQIGSVVRVSNLDSGFYGERGILLEVTTTESGRTWARVDLGYDGGTVAFLIDEVRVVDEVTP